MEIKSGEWNICTIDALKANSNNAIAIGPFGSRMKSDCYVSNGVPVIRGNNISNTKSFTGEFVFITEQKANELYSSNVVENDLVFPHRGAIGEVGIVPQNDAKKFVISSSLMKLTCNQSLVVPLFLFYFFRTPQGKYELLKNASTVGTPGIATPLTSLKSITVPLPPLSEQKAIAHILSSFDDKIELNRQMNETLEAMARAIFKSWFVDFDPVSAKRSGRQPAGMDTATADLFPDEFEESSLGLIPKGWELKSLDEIANFLNGLALQKYPPNSEEYLPVIKIAELRKGITEQSAKASIDIPSDYIVENGDILFSWSGSLVNCIWCGGKGALNQHLFKVTSTKYPKWFYYQWVNYHLPEFQFIAASKATTMGHIQRHHLKEAKVITPSFTLLSSMDKIMNPLFEQVINSNLESHTLATLRDTLLPKLMSGEIRVKEAEKIINDKL